MIASLPMYWRPQLAAAHDRYWTLIRQGLVASGMPAPTELSQGVEENVVWTDPKLVLSQTCGMPYRQRLHDRVALVGTPDLGVDGCAPGYYRSAVVVRADDVRGELVDYWNGVFAYNQTDSQSGYGAIYNHVAKLGFWFENRLHAGNHADSAAAVASCAADIASIDAVSWRMIQRYDETARSLRVIDWTEPTPGLPYIAARDADVGVTFAAVAAAIDGLDVADKEALGIRGLVNIDASEYLAVPDPPDGA